MSRSEKILLVATGNPHKVEEIRAILDLSAVKLLSLRDIPEIGEIVEDGDTFLANAMKKAKTAHAHSGYISLADDSGLEVACLDGRPGVYSSRYAGIEGDDAGNNEKLLRELEGKPPEERRARFKTVMAIVTGDSEYHVEGTCNGYILDQLRGSSGFGYDPLFYVPSHRKTFAEMSMKEKNSISHRSMALRKCSRVLRELF